MPIGAKPDSTAGKCRNNEDYISRKQGRSCICNEKSHTIKMCRWKFWESEKAVCRGCSDNQTLLWWKHKHCHLSDANRGPYTVDIPFLDYDLKFFKRSSITSCEEGVRNKQNQLIVESTTIAARYKTRGKHR